MATTRKSSTKAKTVTPAQPRPAATKSGTATSARSSRENVRPASGKAARGDVEPALIPPFHDDTPSLSRVDKERAAFSGRFPDLKASERQLAAWRVSQPQMVRAQHRSTAAASPPELLALAATAPPSPSSATPAASITARRAASVADSSSVGAVLDAQMGLYLVRSNDVSAAQALSRFDVTFNRESRNLQLSRLREFRADTRAVANSEVTRWIADRLHGRSSLKSNGVISAGVVVPMSHEEARQLRTEVPNIWVLRNRALTLIAPTLSSSPVSQLPERAGWHLEAIGMATARRDGKAFTGTGVNIAVMDTGVQLNHPELAGKVSAAWKLRDHPQTTDFQALEPDPSHFDTDGHGTHVAGLICGNNIGVAPDARLISLMMMPRRLATTFDFVRCLDWAAEHPEVGLVNFSAGITPFTAEMMPFIADVINTGALPIVAVGNDGPNNTRSPGNYVDGASIGSVDSPGQKVSAFSGSGRQVWNQTIYNVPDFVAPGGQVWSSFPGGQYVAMSGTSMAAPVVCGVAACLIEQAGGLLSPLDLLDQLRRGCVKLASEEDVRQGAGLVQVPRKP